MSCLFSLMLLDKLKELKDDKIINNKWNMIKIKH